MFWRRKRSQGDFSSELQSHLALETDRLRAEGLSEAEARRQALQSFGSVTRTEERFYESNRALWLDQLARDIGYGLRRLAKDRMFTLIAVATLALGIGSTTAIFTLVHATLLRALPYRDADRIIHVTDIRLQGQSTGSLMSVPRFFDLQNRSKSFGSLSFYYFDNPTLIAGSLLPTPLAGAGVSGDFWNVLGVQPFIGRTFTKSDDRPNMPGVAVISYSTWQQFFAGDRNAVNRQVILDGKSATIIGVMPPRFQYPNKIEIWTPSHFDPVKWTYRGNGTRFVNVLARLKQNIALSTAQQELRQIGGQLQREYPDTDGAWQFSSEPLRDYLYGSMKTALLMLLAASGVLLLIACINVANLQLSRATVRSREVALRRALGASQRRILIQFLTENTMLSLFGGATGLFTAFVLVYGLGARLPGRLATAVVGLDWQAVCFAFAVSAGTGVLFGLTPALQALRVDLNTNLKRGDLRVGSTAGGGLRSAFISAEVALSLVLLVSASLLAESVWHLMESPLGFQPDHVLTFEIKLPWNNNPTSGTRFYSELQRRIESLPGVTAVGQINALPTADWHERSNFDVDWKPRSAHGDTVNVEDRAIAGDYLRSMHIPLLAGRSFRESDKEAKQAGVLVNQQFVRQYLPKGDPIGRHLVNSMAQFEVIGVIGDVRGTAGSLAKQVGPEVYFLADGQTVGRAFVVRSQLLPEQVIRTIREQVHQIDPTQAIRNVATLDDRLNEAVAQPRFDMSLLTVFAVMALLLACVGVYGIVSYSVTQRSTEIGIRMALGATPMRIFSLFIWRALFPALIGLVAGGGMALLLTRLLRSQLYDVRPYDPLAFGISVMVLLIPVLLASLRPSLQAATVNPVDALRRD